MPDDDPTQQVSSPAGAGSDPGGRFERLYADAERGEAVVPWDLDRAHSLLAEWTDRTRPDGSGRRALVVGCGFGRDAEHLARLGFATVAFDISPTAVRTARRRHPDSPVRYETADLLDPPRDWLGGFDFVLESMNVQALPAELRRRAIPAVGRLVAPDGMLLVIAAGRRDDEAVEGPPWPLTRAEVDAFAAGPLIPARVEEIAAPDGGIRWRAEFRHR
ncbi:methyltransferase domain-containing protein [Micromonospora terminaliae]|uniref:Methyltransferase domain-containing protein n=1 Tax=Micromonospora terminaliae TaxID=1914461 RepID=A0AAJ2ZK37_9ACTN|nr:methyltransferase domain-containing protein [Micromonospora terminaliae]NES30669.1 methyltransferase domain-containing protein [Micromonospora terminaliae]QGL49519.1 methyltransferase domain-containing protein [Micromonospora terminaliae]